MYINYKITHILRRTPLINRTYKANNKYSYFPWIQVLQKKRCDVTRVSFNTTAPQVVSLVNMKLIPLWIKPCMLP